MSLSLFIALNLMIYIHDLVAAVHCLEPDLADYLLAVIHSFELVHMDHLLAVVHSFELGHMDHLLAIGHSFELGHMDHLLAVVRSFELSHMDHLLAVVHSFELGHLLAVVCSPEPSTSYFIGLILLIVVPCLAAHTCILFIFLHTANLILSVSHLLSFNSAVATVASCGALLLNVCNTLLCSRGTSGWLISNI